MLSGKVNLDHYPFRFICIGLSPGSVLSSGLGGFAGANSRLDKVLTAIEFLETRGWQLVSLDQGGLLACLRRHP